MKQAISEITAQLGSASKGQETPLKNQCKLQGTVCTVLNRAALVWRLLVHGNSGTWCILVFSPCVQKLSKDA